VWIKAALLNRRAAEDTEATQRRTRFGHN